jgi:hypothetical protein
VVVGSSALSAGASTIPSARGGRARGRSDGAVRLSAALGARAVDVIEADGTVGNVVGSSGATGTFVGKEAALVAAGAGAVGSTRSVGMTARKVRARGCGDGVVNSSAKASRDSKAAAETRSVNALCSGVRRAARKPLRASLWAVQRLIRAAVGELAARRCGKMTQQARMRHHPVCLDCIV